MTRSASPHGVWLFFVALTATSVIDAQAQQTADGTWSVALGGGYANVSHINQIYPFTIGGMVASPGPAEYPGEPGVQLEASVTRTMTPLVNVTVAGFWGSSPFVLITDAPEQRLIQYGFGLEPTYQFLPESSFRPLMGGYFGWRRMASEQSVTRPSDSATVMEEAVFETSSWDIGWILGFSQRLSNRVRVEAFGRFAWLNLFAVRALASRQVTSPEFPTSSGVVVEVSPVDADGFEASLKIRVAWALQ